jgi:hypothetical protein
MKIHGEDVVSDGVTVTLTPEEIKLMYWLLSDYHGDFPVGADVYQEAQDDANELMEMLKR